MTTGLAAEIPIAGDSTAANKDAPTYATLYKVANIGGAGAAGTQVNPGAAAGAQPGPQRQDQPH